MTNKAILLMTCSNGSSNYDHRLSGLGLVGGLYTTHLTYLGHFETNLIIPLMTEVDGPLWTGPPSFTPQ